MTVFLTAIGLMFVIEGAMYAAFPRGMRDMISKISALDDARIRQIGLILVIFGFLVMAALHGF